MSDKFVIMVTGPTCSGKTTALDLALKNPNNRAMGCFIGREMRKRHPPEYFKGLMASPDTEPEVRAIFLSVYEDFLQSDSEFLLCDGIPRLESQVDFLRSVFAGDTKSVQWTSHWNEKGPSVPHVALIRFNPSDDTRRERMRQRGGTEAEQALSESRFSKDVEMLQVVYSHIAKTCPDWGMFGVSGEDDPGIVVQRLEMIMQYFRLVVT